MTRPPGRPATTACCAKKSYRVVFERRSNPLGGRGNRLSSSFEAASERRRSDACRPLHYDKPGSFKMVHKSGGDDLGHDLVRVVDALAALISQCEGEGGCDIGAAPAVYVEWKMSSSCPMAGGCSPVAGKCLAGPHRP